MPEPLKNLYNAELIGTLCSRLQQHYPSFQSAEFTKVIFDQHWAAKELKQRMRHIAESLQQFLPPDYATAIGILKPVAAECSGFEYMFFQDFVECFGLDDYDISIPALAHFTKYASSEFAVRQFIIKYPSKMMAQMLAWAESENHHIRRLATEGCRPRLPWAIALPVFKKDPAPVLELLHKLKHDDSEYVRRSVANNLNDISKDNPEIVSKIAQQWLGKNKDTDWLVKHACRTLLKQGNTKILRLFGFANVDHIRIETLKIQSTVGIDERLEFSFSLNTDQNQLGKIRLEYGIDFMKKNGKPARKIFKISEAEVTDSNKSVIKSHSFKRISTRKYYAGAHGLVIIVNGKPLASGAFELLQNQQVLSA